MSLGDLQASIGLAYLFLAASSSYVPWFWHIFLFRSLQKVKHINVLLQTYRFKVCFKFLLNKYSSFLFIAYDYTFYKLI